MDRERMLPSRAQRPSLWSAYLNKHRIGKSHAHAYGSTDVHALNSRFGPRTTSHRSFKQEAAQPSAATDVSDRLRWSPQMLQKEGPHSQVAVGLGPVGLMDRSGGYYPAVDDQSSASGAGPTPGGSREEFLQPVPPPWLDTGFPVSAGLRIVNGCARAGFTTAELEMVEEQSKRYRKENKFNFCLSSSHSRTDADDSLFAECDKGANSDAGELHLWSTPGFPSAPDKRNLSPGYFPRESEDSIGIHLDEISSIPLEDPLTDISNQDLNCFGGRCAQRSSTVLLPPLPASDAAVPRKLCFDSGSAASRLNHAPFLSRDMVTVNREAKSAIEEWRPHRSEQIAQDRAVPCKPVSSKVKVHSTVSAGSEKRVSFVTNTFRHDVSASRDNISHTTVSTEPGVIHGCVLKTSNDTIFADNAFSWSPVLHPHMPVPDRPKNIGVTGATRSTKEMGTSPVVTVTSKMDAACSPIAVHASPHKPTTSERGTSPISYSFKDDTERDAEEFSDDVLTTKPVTSSATETGCSASQTPPPKHLKSSFLVSPKSLRQQKQNSNLRTPNVSPIV